MNASAQPVRRGFWAFIALQFQGAFNDNVVKMMLTLFAATLFSAEVHRQEKYSAIISALIPAAFLLFSCWAGMLADKFSKRSVILTTKTVELLIMALFFLVFWAAMHVSGLTYSNFMLAMLVASMLFVHSVFFSPAKYGIIPELVPEERVTWANGILNMTTFLSIILGTSISTFLFATLEKNHQLHWLPAGLFLLSLIGLILGFRISPTPAANPGRSFDINYIPELKRYFTILFSKRTLALTVAGLVYFWSVGILLLTHVLPWGMHSMGLSKTQAGFFFVDLALGIGVGSMLAGLLSRDRIETGLIPLGSLGIALFCIPLAFASPHAIVIGVMAVSLFLVGVSAGLYSVPLNAILQVHTDKADRGGLLAATSYFTDSGMVLSMVLYAILTSPNLLGLSPNMIFVFIALLTLVGTVMVLRILPEALLRLVAFLFVRVVYRLHVTGRDHIPTEGAALLVSNHTSFADALLIQAASPRPVRFVVWEGLYRKPVLRWFLKTMRCIPVSADQRPRDLIASLRRAAGALKEGELLCIFAEGQITRTGVMLPFRRGYQIILKEAPAAVVPVCLDGVWGSVFSFERGKFFWKWPRRLPYPVRLAIGEPFAADIAPFTLRQRIEELGAEAAKAAQPHTPPLHVTFIRQARRYWRMFFMTDVHSPPITMGQALWRSIIMARRLAPEWAGQDTVGIMLPPSVGGALVNYAAALSGRTVVNLNYTTGQAVLESCAHRAGLQTVVTARTFLEKVKLEPPARAIYIEDYRGFHGLGEVIRAILIARLAPVRWVERYCKAFRRVTTDTLATIIFSSGSTGEPKGVMLSNFNIAANVESFRQGIRIWPNDRMLGTLPFFHSFGYTVSLWGGVAFPFPSVFHLSPLDVKIIGELCEKHTITIIVTTPTFLQHYLRRVTPEQFGGINCVITGAERLTDTLRIAFHERFGVEPLQGYGTTECSPVVSTNIDDYRSPGFHQVFHKRGSIGHPLPGIAARTVHTETREPLGPGQPGLLLIKGPNIMQGYLGMPEKTAEVIEAGWYNTGDVAYIDEDGFVFITDRLSRFSKIGGEMVPHVRIEEKLHEALGLTETKLVVTAVPDERKGEQLVVLHTLDDAALDRVGERLAATGMPNLWVPRRENFFKIDQIPILGTGKLDLSTVRKTASEKIAARTD